MRDCVVRKPTKVRTSRVVNARVTSRYGHERRETYAEIPRATRTAEVHAAAMRVANSKCWSNPRRCSGEWNSINDEGMACACSLVGFYWNPLYECTLVRGSNR